MSVSHQICERAELENATVRSVVVCGVISSLALFAVILVLWKTFSFSKADASRMRFPLWNTRFFSLAVFHTVTATQVVLTSSGYVLQIFDRKNLVLDS